MFALVLIFVLLVVSIPLYLDYKKNPLDNIAIKNLTILNENKIVQKIIEPIVPHADKYKINKLFIMPIIVLILFFLLILIF